MTLREAIDVLVNHARRAEEAEAERNAPSKEAADRLDALEAALRQAVSRFEALLDRGDFDESDRPVTRELVARWKRALGGQP